MGQIPHKFELGEMVECKFIGDVVGVSVTVTKRLFVRAMALSQGGIVMYSVVEKMQRRSTADSYYFGTQFEKSEDELIKLEPVVAEIGTTRELLKVD